VEEGPRFVESEATAWDLETNVAIRIRSRRRITDSMGNRYSDDMIGVTSNAASSIALRNAIFRVVPKSVVEQVYMAARNVAVGGQSTLSMRRQKMIESFGKMGVAEERLLGRLDRPGVNDITLDDLEKAIGLFNEIKNGEADIDEMFPEPRQEFVVGASSPNAPVSDVPPGVSQDELPPGFTQEPESAGVIYVESPGPFKHVGGDARKVEYVWTALLDDANGDTGKAAQTLALLTEFSDGEGKTVAGVERFEDLSPKRLGALFIKVKRMVDEAKTKSTKKGKGKTEPKDGLPFK